MFQKPNLISVSRNCHFLKSVSYGNFNCNKTEKNTDAPHYSFLKQFNKTDALSKYINIYMYI